MLSSTPYPPRDATFVARRTAPLAKPFVGPRWRRLMRAATALRARTLPEASGRCLALSLDFCRVARRQGVPAELVVWSVNRDRHYRDHWAVLLGPGLVIDLTRVQVDGSREMVHALDSYPTNYRRPRTYPSALLLAPCDEAGRGAGDPVQFGVHQTLRRLMFVHDLAHARSLGDLWRVGHSALSWAKAVAVCTVLGIEQQVLQRRGELQGRLQARLQARP